MHCGSGVTAAVIAAVHPDAEVWAVDDRPANVERTDRLVTGAGLRNVMVLEAGPRRRRAATLRRHRRSSTMSSRPPTRPVGHGSPASSAGTSGLAGSSSSATARGSAGPRSSRYAASPRSSHRRGERPTGWQLRAIVDLLERLRAGGARYIVDRPAVSALVEQAGSMDGEQLSDILLTEHLEPMALADVAEWLTPTGEVFVGSAQSRALESPPTRRWSTFSKTRRTSRLREAFSDLVARPTFRIDMFRRGTALLPADEHRSMLLDLELVGLSAGTRPDGGALADDEVARAVDLLARRTGGRRRAGRGRRISAAHRARVAGPRAGPPAFRRLGLRRSSCLLRVEPMPGCA